jgi:hypothetical protein
MPLPKQSLRRVQLILAMLLAYMVTSTASWAQEASDVPGYPPTIDGYDPREVGMLPRFCIHTQVFRERVPGGSNPQQIERWRAIMGPTFEAMHHYCWGLMKTNRAVLLVRSSERRQFYLNDSLGEFDWVIQRAPENFILLPEVLVKKGENLVRLNKGPSAVYAFERAIELKPDYWPPYAQMSDYYKAAGNTARAREVLAQGLAQIRNSPALLRRAGELNVAVPSLPTAPASQPVAPEAAGAASEPQAAASEPAS